MSEPLTFAFPAARTALIFIDGETETAHMLSARDWSASDLDYVQRATLAARLRAVADFVDPGSLDNYLLRLELTSSAEGVTRA